MVALWRFGGETIDRAELYCTTCVLKAPHTPASRTSGVSDTLLRKRPVQKHWAAISWTVFFLIILSWMLHTKPKKKQKKSIIFVNECYCFNFRRSPRRLQTHHRRPKSTQVQVNGNTRRGDVLAQHRHQHQTLPPPKFWPPSCCLLLGRKFTTPDRTQRSNLATRARGAMFAQWTNSFWCHYDAAHGRAKKCTVTLFFIIFASSEFLSDRWDAPPSQE